MPLVDSDVAEWLRSEALYTKGANALVPSGLITGGTESEIISALSILSDADAETTRQVSYLGYTLAIDAHTVKGQQKDLLGKPVTLTGDYLGYDTSPTVFVIGAEEGDDNTTQLTVVRRLT